MTESHLKFSASDYNQALTTSHYLEEMDCLSINIIFSHHRGQPHSPCLIGASHFITRMKIIGRENIFAQKFFLVPHIIASHLTKVSAHS